MKTAIIVVLYNCSAGQWEEYEGEEEVVIVDNTPHRDLALKGEHFSYIPLKANLGIAAAQNAGMVRARELGCDFAVFFDQDSIPPEGFAQQMVEEYQRLDGQVGNLFLLGPTVVNGRTGEEYISKIHADSTAYTDLGFIPRRDVISSGSCVSLAKAREVGPLEERLFIDTVDYEWCWRAASKGFVNGITRRAELRHFVGAADFTCLGQQVIISAPFRYFYQGRNHILLLPRSYVPMQWKINTLLKRCFHMAVIPFHTPLWPAIYANLLRGTLAGLGLPFKPKHCKA